MNILVKVFDRATTDKKYIYSLSEIFDYIENKLFLSFKRDDLEIDFNLDEISVIGYTKDSFSSGANNFEISVFYFNVKTNTCSNGADNFDFNDFDWSSLNEIYNYYAGKKDKFINAMIAGDLKTSKELYNLEDGTVPSIADSFYIRRVIKSGDINFLKWAKEIDPYVNFTIANRHENPLKIAIGYRQEETAIWLLDNYDVYPFERSGRKDDLGLIKQAKKMEMFKLFDKLISREDVINKILELNQYEILPENIKETFIF